MMHKDTSMKIKNTAIGFSILAVSVSLAGCVKVSDLMNQIPSLFVISYAVTFVALIRARLTSMFLSVVSAFCILLLVYFSVEKISETLGTEISNYVTYFLIQIIPFLLYTWLVALGLVTVRKKYPEKFQKLPIAVFSGIPAFIVLCIYLGFLFSGFCYDCYISNTFQQVFGWPFNLLDMIK
jgi:hypothetical protein